MGRGGAEEGINTEHVFCVFLFCCTVIVRGGGEGAGVWPMSVVRSVYGHFFGDVGFCTEKFSV